jgi:hypothetical protein
MNPTASIFVDVNLPNPPTWSYFSGLLAVALFFKFSRLLSVRNLDVLTLFLPVPGFLLLVQEDGRSYLGYLWLLLATLYFLVRCLLDLTLVRRPALGPNLDLGGLAWLAGALFVGLIAVAAREPAGPPEPGDKAAPTDKVRDALEQGARLASPPAEGADVGVWVERGLALLCHLSVVVGLTLIGWRHFDDLRSGMSAATCYLLLPYAYLLPASAPRVGGWDHAWAMALMVWAVFTYRRPTLAGAFLGLAAGTAFFPVLTVPVWLSFYRRGGAARFALSFVLCAGLCLAAIGVVLWGNDELPSSLRSAWTESAWQPWKRPHPDTFGLWQDIPRQSAYRLPVFLAGMALVVTTAIWPNPKNLAHVLALSAAVLLSIQFWYADRGGVYVLWYLPFLLLLVFRPNLVGAQPPPPPADDRLARLGRRLGHVALRLLRRLRRRPPEPAVRAG